MRAGTLAPALGSTSMQPRRNGSLTIECIPTSQRRLGLFVMEY